MSQPTEDPQAYIADLLNEIDTEGKVDLSHAYRMGRKWGLSERFVDDILEMLGTEGHIQKEGDHYIFTPASLSSVKREAEKLSKKHMVRKAWTIPPMPFTPPKPGPKPY